jgi:Ca-activated chloride channel family protein
LLTPFTSFVAVDQEIANRSGQSTPVRQPLPMPEGVSNLAVAEAAAPLKSMGAMGYGAGGGGMGAVGAMGRAASAAPVRSKRMAADSPLAGLAPAAPPARPEPKAEKEDDQKVAAGGAIVSVVSTAGLSSPELLLAAVKARLAGVRWNEAPRRAGQVTLRIDVDGSGRIVSVAAIAGDPGLVAFLRGKLLNLTSGARATGKLGTWTVAIRVN